LIETVVNTSHSVHGGGDFSQEDGFLESGFSGQFTSIIETTSCGDDLSTTSVDGVGVEDTIVKIESDTSHLFFGHDGFLGGPLESGFHGISDFVHVLNSLGGINEDVGTSVFGTKVPELGTSFGLIPIIGFREILRSFLGIILGTNLTLLDIIGKTFIKCNSLSVYSVVLVGGLSHTHLVRFSGNSFLEGNDGVRLDDGALSKIVFKILKTDFNVEFTTTSNDILTTFFCGNED